VVMATFTLTMTAKDAATAGNIRINGLPFTVTNLTNLLHGCALATFSNITLSAGMTQLTGRAGANTTRIELFENGSGAANLPIAAAAVAATTNIAGTVVYRTA
jgi:hypothetical protein